MYINIYLLGSDQKGSSKKDQIVRTANRETFRSCTLAHCARFLTILRSVTQGFGSAIQLTRTVVECADVTLLCIIENAFALWAAKMLGSALQKKLVRPKVVRLIAQIKLSDDVAFARFCHGFLSVTFAVKVQPLAMVYGRLLIIRAIGAFLHVDVKSEIAKAAFAQLLWRQVQKVPKSADVGAPVDILVWRPSYVKLFN